MTDIRPLPNPTPARRRQRLAQIGIALTLTLTLIFGLAGTAATAHAQDIGDGFYFRPPAGTLTLRGGFARPDAASDLFDFVIEEHTLDRSDFNGPAIGFDLSLRLSPRLDLVLGTGFSRAKRRSEFRYWVDLDDQPIEQTTEFQRLPVTAGLKAYVIPRGRKIGSFAWLPARWAPYVGIGGGITWYRFSQEGDFVFATQDEFGDDEYLDILPARFSSEGWAPVGHLFAGFDLSLGLRWALNIEGRYARASHRLGHDYEGFEPIDLSGLTTTIGIQFRFQGARQ